MKFTTLIPTLALLCVAAINSVVSAADVGQEGEVPRENVAADTSTENVAAGITPIENLGTNWIGKDAQGNPIYIPNRVTVSTEGSIFMGKDAQDNPIYVPNRVNAGVEGATMMMVSRDALFNMVTSTCETLANANPIFLSGCNVEQAEHAVAPNECSVEVIKTWWDALCGEYSHAKQRNFHVSGTENQVVLVVRKSI